jgi:uncharacterized iron-regulated protein
MRRVQPFARLSSILMAIVALVGLAACTPTPPQDNHGDMSGTDHPLNERIWSVRDARFITPRDLTRHLKTARFILAGEHHDNPRHHELQAWILRALAEGGRRPAIPMEMIAEDQAGGLKLFYDAPRTNADKLPFFLKWDQSGWPDWALYAPVANTAVRFAMPIAWANFARDDMIAMYDKSWDALHPDRRAALGLNRPIPADLLPVMETEIAVSHCGSLPPDKVTRFTEIQFARDALMARRMMETATEDGAVLITGNGHARRDRGVAWHLNRLNARGRVLSVGLIEVKDGADSPDAYDLPYDMVWFTTGLDRTDPCAAFRS